MGGLEREGMDDGDGDDASAEGLIREPDDARLGEVTTLVHDLNVDERTDLVALMLIGRDEFDLTDWEGARAAAQEELGSGGLHEVVGLLAGDEAAPGFREGGLDAFGYSIADWDAETIGGQPEESGDAGPGDVVDDAQRQAPGRVGTR